MHSQWVQPFTGGYTIDQLKIDPQTSQRMYYNEYAVTGSVFKSNDWGVTWSSCQNPIFARTFLIDSLQPNILYVGLRENGVPGIVGVHKSVDYGNSWWHTGLGIVNISSLAQDIVNSTKIYAGGNESGNPAFYISTSGGLEWISFADNLPSQSTVSAINPTDFAKESYSAAATAFSACKMIYSPHTNNIWFSYNGHNRIINCQAVDILDSWIRKDLGPGEYPCIYFDGTDNPCAVWQQNIEAAPIYKKGKLWFSKHDGTNWSEPCLLFAASGSFGADFNLPTFTIDPLTNIGYTAFEIRYYGMNGPVSTLCLGKFTVDNPNDFDLMQLESVSAPYRCDYPSITHDDVYLYIAFQREDKIYRYKMELISGNIVDRIQLSEDGRFSHRPYVDVQANGRVNYVWEDSTVDNIDIFWQYEDSPFLPENVSNTPGISQWPQICRGTTWLTWSEYLYPPTDHNWDIYYTDFEYPSCHNLSQTPLMSKYSHGVVMPPGWPPPYEPELFAIWTEGNQIPYEIQAKRIVIPTPAYFYVDAGKINPSTWTMQRQGYMQFSPDPEKIIDYHPEKLIYRFSNLHPAKRYRIKLVFYYESSNPNRWRMKINGDNILHANIKLTEGEITVFERILPPACYKDSTLVLNIEKVIGDYALVAQIFIYEDDYESEKIAKNTEESAESPDNEYCISVNPNPFQSSTMISVSSPATALSTRSFSIFDASGRLVRQFNCKNENQLKVHNISWNGTDEKGNILPNGIYFLMLENNLRSKTAKVIFMH